MYLSEAYFLASICLIFEDKFSKQIRGYVQIETLNNIEFTIESYNVTLSINNGVLGKNSFTIQRNSGDETTFEANSGYEEKGTTISCNVGITGTIDVENKKVILSHVVSGGNCTVDVARQREVSVTVVHGTVDESPKLVKDGGNITFTVTPETEHYLNVNVNCTGSGTYTLANNILSLTNVGSDMSCTVTYTRPTYTITLSTQGGTLNKSSLTLKSGNYTTVTFTDRKSVV